MINPIGIQNFESLINIKWLLPDVIIFLVVPGVLGRVCFFLRWKLI